MTHVDGNALGGLFTELFGREMTDERGCCGACGSVNRFGALLAYLDAPGAVVRCPVCDSVLVVAVAKGGAVRVTFGSMRWMEITA